MSTKRKKIVWFVVWALAVPVFAWSQLNFYKSVYAADSISDLKDEKNEIEDKLEKEQQALAKKQQELSQVNSAVYSTQSEINKTQTALMEVEQTIIRKELEIVNLEDQIRLKEEMLKNFLREIYYIKSQSAISVVLSESNFTDMFSGVDHLLTLEDKIMNISKELARTKTQIEQDKVKLADIKEQHEDVLEGKIDEKQDLLADKAVVAGAVAEKEATVEELKETGRT